MEEAAGLGDWEGDGRLDKGREEKKGKEKDKKRKKKRKKEEKKGNLDFYNLNLTSEAVLPNIFQNSFSFTREARTGAVFGGAETLPAKQALHLPSTPGSQQ